MLAERDAISVVHCLTDFNHGRIQDDLGFDGFSKAPDQAFVASFDAVQLQIMFVVHKDVLDAVQRAGQVRRRGHVSVCGSSHIAPRHFIGNTIQEFSKSLIRPRMQLLCTPVVVVIIVGGAERLTLSVERIDGRQRGLAQLASDIAVGIQDFVAKNHRTSTHGYRRKPQAFNEFPKRVVTKTGVMVELGDSCLIEDRHRAEGTGNHLPAQPV